MFSNLFPVSYERYVEEHMTNVRKCNLMPEEIFSEKNRMADDGTLCKTLFYDIRRQARVPAAITSVDASNCYDRIAHAIASLVFQAFGHRDNARRDRKYEFLPTNRVWRFKVLCRGWGQR
jgi:hypothetical protein